MHIWSIMTGLKPLSHWQRNIPGVFIQLPLLQMPKEIWHSLISKQVVPVSSSVYPWLHLQVKLPRVFPHTPSLQMSGNSTHSLMSGCFVESQSFLNSSESLRGQVEQSGPQAFPREQQHFALEYLPSTGRPQDPLEYSKKQVPSLLSMHLLPEASSISPGGQLHLNEPCVLTHSPPPSQTFSNISHSFISIQFLPSLLA